MIADLHKKIIEAHPKLTGWCSLEKALTLASLVVAIRPKTVIEIGVWGGKSFIPMALACREIGNSICIGIDAWDAKVSVKNEVKEHKEWWGIQDHEKVFQDFMSKLVELRLDDICKIRKTKSDDVEPVVSELLHIDGNHTDQAISDAERFGSIVPVGGIVVCDDLNWVGGGTRRAVDALTEMGFTELYRVMNDTDSWNVMQRASR